MTRSLIIGFAIFSLLLLNACKGGQSDTDKAEGDTVHFRYATLLQVVRHRGYTAVSIRDPWHKGRTLHSYILVPKGHKAPAGLSGTVVQVPLRRSVVFTTAHCQLLYYLKAQQAIAGVCDLNYMQLPDLHRRARQGDVVDCGNAMSPMLERIIELNPDALLISPFENSGGFGKVEQLGVPIIETADYMETSALGRAEWMRFYGMLYGKEHEADSLFQVVDSSYTALKQQAARLPQGLKVLTERKNYSVWYCPGGQSTMGRLIRDAHGSYAFAADRHSGSLALAAEEVLDKAGDSDVWMFIYNGPKMPTRQQLLSEYHGYEGLKAFREGHVYGCDCTSVPYFEEIPFRPDYLLRDFVQLLHPGVRLGGLRYYKPVNLKI